MHLSIPLIGLIGLTFAAANPVTVGGAPSPACLAKCNAAYTRCDETADAQTGIVSGGEAVTW